MMLCILASLLGAVLHLDTLSLSTKEYFLLRAPFALHLGWIICASVVNANVFADSTRASPSALLTCAVVGLVVIVGVSTAFACGARTPEPIVSFVAAWALLAVGVELSDATNLNTPSRFNPYMWDSVVLQGLQHAAIAAFVVALVLALLAIAARLRKVLR